ncbi:MAG TPA: hypothetical protein VFG42_21185 [Baekduia sp.]|uniref:hypothetical protein n=1 Tax=Baekduia sp. TaxID=2600305 RepID=UPI002D77AD3D|nr:hypothetical protein [Baekduia sp.]HET6509325.1 hypothetical protein [Baekduia sp.]
MSRVVLVLVTLQLTAALLAGCGNDAESSSGAPRGVAALKGDPALARAPKRPGELLFRASASPQTEGPVTLDGRYTVRFEQYAPEDPHLDFTTQTAFVADLQTPSGRPAQHLFSAARSSGTKTITAHGRYLVDVSFGDFPYVLRFTPAGG